MKEDQRLKQQQNHRSDIVEIKESQVRQEEHLANLLEKFNTYIIFNDSKVSSIEKTINGNGHVGLKTKAAINAKEIKDVDSKIKDHVDSHWKIYGLLIALCTGFSTIIGKFT